MRRITRFSCLAVVLLSLAPLAAAASPTGGTSASPPPGGEPLLLVRYAFLVGGRGPQTAPPGGGVLGQKELEQWLIEWDPDADHAEMRKIFALNDLGEVVRQAAVLPASGGELVGTFDHRGARFDVRLTLKMESAAVISTKASVTRNGQAIFAPEMRSAPGERTIASTTDGPEAPFLFLVVEADRTSRNQIDRVGLSPIWLPAQKTVDGHRIVPPRLLESVEPEYPEEAKQKGIQGMVVLRLRLDEEGAISLVNVVQGQPEGLTEAAIAAVKAWRYAPATEGGFPVAVTYTVTIAFKLSQH